MVVRAAPVPFSASVVGRAGLRRHLRALAPHCRQAAAAAASRGPSPSPAMDFQLAASFDDLLAANLRYLRGEGLRDSPFHHGPLAAETAPLICGLARLHTQLRMFTFESQPGLVHARWVGGPSGSDDGASASSSGSDAVGGSGSGSSGSAMWWVTEQRAYVDAWVEPATLSQLLPRLRATPGLYFFADIPGRPEAFSHNVPRTAAWLDGSRRAHLNLTRERGGATPAAAAAASWVLHTNAPLRPGWADAELDLLARQHPNVAKLLSGCALVGVMAADYGPEPPGHPSLLDALLGAHAAA